MRKVYESIDEAKDIIYGMCREIQLISDADEAKRLARYAFKELLPAFDTLMFTGGVRERIGYTAEDRSDRNVEAGHGPITDSGTENVSGWGLP